MRLSGKELFSRLRATELDGIVFNPAGPNDPVALARMVADTVRMHAPALAPFSSRAARLLYA